MAVALVGAAKVILPALYDGYQKHEQIVAAAKQCETSLGKAEELLSMDATLKQRTPKIMEARLHLETTVSDLTKYLKEMSVASKDTSTKTEEKSLVGKAMNLGAKVASSVVTAAKTGIEAVLVDRVAELSTLNSKLLIACVDLSLAIQRMGPPKSTFCTIA